MTRARFLLLFGGIFASVGAVVLAVGIGLGVARAVFAASAVPVQGVVVEVEYRGYPVVEFASPADGQIYRIRGSVASSPPAYHPSTAGTRSWC